MALSRRERAAFDAIAAELYDSALSLGSPKISTGARVAATLAQVIGIGAAGTGAALIATAGPVPLAGLLLTLIGAFVIIAARRSRTGFGSPPVARSWTAGGRSTAARYDRFLSRRSTPTPKQLRREQRRLQRRQRRRGR